MKYKIEFELPDNETVRKKIDSTYISWSVWGFSGIAKAEPIRDPQMTEADEGLQLFADILFDKNKTTQFLEECKAIDIEL